jgi:hypothetical protein
MLYNERRIETCTPTFIAGQSFTAPLKTMGLLANTKLRNSSNEGTPS